MAYADCRACRCALRSPPPPSWRQDLPSYSCCATCSPEDCVMQLFTALIAGLIFGIGLILSGMSDPAKVLGFLDLAGNWDPSLMFVMGGAILVAFPAFRLAGRRQRSPLGAALQLPGERRLTGRLVFGALAFGAGWGLAGYCPGPALASLASGGLKPLLFCGAMLAGMGIFEVLQRHR